MKKAVPFILCATLMTTGCANIQNDHTRTTTEGTLVGAGVGAGLGALIGELAGSAGLGALIGGVVGAGAGALVGKHIADSKAEYASQEEWLDACILQAQETNTQLIAQNAQLKAEIATLDKESSTLMAAYRRQEVSSQTLKSEKSKIDSRQKELQEMIASMEAEVNKQKTVVTDARTNNNTREADIIEHEIEKMEIQIAELKAETNKLANMSMRISI